MQQIPLRFEILTFSRAEQEELASLVDQLLRHPVTIAKSGIEHRLELLKTYLPPQNESVPSRFLIEFSEEALAALYLNDDPRYALATDLIKRAIGNI